jgi:hypothetical protein
LMSLTGDPDGSAYRSGVSVFDIMTGLQAKACPRSARCCPEHCSSWSSDSHPAGSWGRSRHYPDGSHLADPSGGRWPRRSSGRTPVARRAAGPSSSPEPTAGYPVRGRAREGATPRRVEAAAPRTRDDPGLRPRSYA